MNLLTESELAHIRREFDVAVNMAYAQGIHITHGKFGLAQKMADDGTGKLVFIPGHTKTCCPTAAYLLGKNPWGGNYSELAAKYIGIGQAKYAFFAGFYSGFDTGLRYPTMSDPYDELELGSGIFQQGKKFGWDYAQHLQADMPEVILIR